MIGLNNKTEFITLTLSRQLCQKAKEYDDSINFTLGDPDLNTPKEICKAAYEAALAGNTHYAPNAGIPSLRTAVCKYVNKNKSTSYSDNNVVITVGAVEAIFLASMALLNYGDEVIIFAPYWSQYSNICKLLGATPIVINEYKQALEPKIESIKDAINSKTKAIIINNPNNPSGCVYSKEFLEAVSKIAIEYNLYIFADEVYDTLVYDDSFVSLAKYCPKENLVLFGSCSKTFAMTGWRIGYVLANETYTASIIKLQQNIAASVPSITQYAALEAFSNPEKYIKPIKDIFADRRECILRELAKIPGIKYSIPQGTFYVFIDISSTGLKSKEFCFSLLEKEHVALVPGIAYGECFDNYVRLAYTLDVKVLKEGISRLSRFILNKY